MILCVAENSPVVQQTARDQRMASIEILLLIARLKWYRPDHLVGMRIQITS
jgi:hypothetical protein